jgi:hypothetical protein
LPEAATILFRFGSTSDRSQIIVTLADDVNCRTAQPTVVFKAPNAHVSALSLANGRGEGRQEYDYDPQILADRRS